MNHRKLGHSQLAISETGFGCMSLQNDQQENERILHRAIELGINFFDTADLYNKGMNEVSVGKALKQKRNQVILATKVGNQWRTDGSGWDWNPRKAYILQAIDKSLDRLQTDYIDLYQLHGGTIEDPIDETIEAFELLQQQGKICYYGISSIRPNVIREYVKRSSIASVMMQYSLLDRRPEESCLQLLQQHNIGVLCRGALAQGLLVNKPAKEYLGHPAQAVGKAAAAIQSIANPTRTAAQTAMQFVLHHPAVTAPVAGIRTMEQLEEMATTSDAPPLTEAQFQTLLQSIPALTYGQHR
jgi:aryl-alcohol dehydrogenase-like predicted oxidoreductase